MTNKLLKKGLLLMSVVTLGSASLPVTTVFASSSNKYIIENDSTKVLDAEKPDALEEVPAYYKSISFEEIKSGVNEKVYTYPDGSTFEISIEDTNQSQILPRSVSNSAYGSRYNNQQFTLKRGNQTASMRIDGYLARKGYGKSKIDNAFGGATSGFGTTGSNSLKIIRKEEDTLTSRSALAELKWTVSGTIGASWGGLSGSIPKGSTCYMYVAFIKGQVKVSDRIP